MHYHPYCKVRTLRLLNTVGGLQRILASPEMVVIETPEL